jgi:hypothetical protein
MRGREDGSGWEAGRTREDKEKQKWEGGGRNRKDLIIERKGRNWREDEKRQAEKKRKRYRKEMGGREAGEQEKRKEGTESISGEAGKRRWGKGVRPCFKKIVLNQLYEGPRFFLLVTEGPVCH